MISKVFYIVAVLFVAVVVFVEFDKPSNAKQEKFDLPAEVLPSPKAFAPALKSKNILRLVVDESRTVFLTTEVNEVSVANIIGNINKYNKRNSKPIYLFIDSPGGEVFSGSQLVSVIQSSKAPVYTVCMKLCASMAAIIHQYGAKRYAMDRSVLMFHPAAGMVGGEVDKMVSRLGMIQRYVNKMSSFIANRSGMSFQEFRERLMVEFWLDAEDAKALNFVEDIVSTDVTTPAPGFGPESKYINLRWE